MPVRDAKILILCKTYPSPSGRYAETSCVAGMDEDGNLVRLFPVPFRMITKEQQFKKWQWIEAKVDTARADHRPESLNVKVDTIEGGDEVPTLREWAERREFLQKIKLFTHFDEIENERLATGRSLALLKPSRIVGLDVVPVARPEWTLEELAKLEQQQRQGGLFDEAEKSSIRTLRKLPYDFYYRYECESDSGVLQRRHKIVDWEIGALFWNCRKHHRDHWETTFRNQLMESLPSRDLMLLMGNIHRFPDQWLIISLIYPPIQVQGSLF